MKQDPIHLSHWETISGGFGGPRPACGARGANLSMEGTLDLVTCPECADARAKNLLREAESFSAAARCAMRHAEELRRDQSQREQEPAT